MVGRVNEQQSLTNSRITQVDGIKNIEFKNAIIKENNDTEMREKELNEYAGRIDRDQIKDLVDGINEFLAPVPTSLRFELHEKLNEYYVKIINDSTQEVIRETPPKKMLDLYAAMVERLGLIIDRKI